MKKSLNLGLNLLRILLTFGVVLDHFWWTATPEQYVGFDKLLWQWRTIAVPAFMTMTFFFAADHFRAMDLPWLRRRFARLYEPFVFWALVYFAAHLVAVHFDSWYRVSFSDLLWQLALGSSRNLSMQFWFHSDLIILTAIFFAAFRVVRSVRANVYLALGAIALGFTFQYTPLNDRIFGWMTFEAKYPLGRLACMLPYAGAGFLLAAAKGRIDSASGGIRVAVAVFGLWLAWLVTFRPVCPRPPSIPGYAGLNMCLIAWGVMACFYYLPFGRLPSIVSSAVDHVSRYCMGVYCIHFLLGQLVFDFVWRLPRTDTPYGELRIFTIGQCLVVWVLSYGVCWLIARVPAGLLRRVVV